MGTFKEGQGLVDLFGCPLAEGDVVAYPRASSGSAWMKIGIIKGIKLKSARHHSTGEVVDDINVSMIGAEVSGDKIRIASRHSTLTKTNELVKVFSDKLPQTNVTRLIFEEAKKYKKADSSQS